MRRLVGSIPLAALTLAALAPAAGLAATCDDAKASPDWDRAFRYAVSATEDRLVVEFEVAPCFHAYAPDSETGQPLAVELTGGDFSAAGPTKYPRGVQEEGPFGRRVVIRGKGRIVLPLSRVDRDASRVQAELHYHVCTDNACGPPRHVKIAAAAT